MGLETRMAREAPKVDPFVLQCQEAGPRTGSTTGTNPGNHDIAQDLGPECAENGSRAYSELDSTAQLALSGLSVPSTARPRVFNKRDQSLTDRKRFYLQSTSRKDCCPIDGCRSKRVKSPARSESVWEAGRERIPVVVRGHEMEDVIVSRWWIRIRLSLVPWFSSSLASR